MNPLRLAARACLLALSAPSAAAAADYCVASGTEFLQSLEAAADSAEDDTLRLVGTTLSMTQGVVLTVHGSLAIRGGYAPGCPEPRSVGGLSSLQGVGNNQITLRVFERDITLERLHVGNFQGMAILSGDSGEGTRRVGQILVQRSAWVGNQSGLLISSATHDVRVESSLFVGSQAEGGNIFAGVGLGVRRAVNARADVDLSVVNVTAIGNRTGIVLADALDGQVHEDMTARLVNSVSYANRAFDLTLRLPAVLEHSLWMTEDFGHGGAALPDSGGNLHQDPLLDGNHRPVEPLSPLIDSGNDYTPGGLPARDHAGAARRIGARVDRGAYENTNSGLPTLSVTSSADSGAGTLRQALLDVNAGVSEQRIEFAIPGTCPAIIALASPLPPLTTAATIAGQTQPGSIEAQDPRLFDGTTCVVLDGGGSVDTGLHFATVGVDQRMEVSGLAFYGFDREAIRVSGPGRGVLRGNTFGTGAALLGQGFADSVIRIEDAPGTLVGGRSPQARNVIGRGALHGIHLLDSNAGRSVTGNSFGLGLSGNTPLANGTGILVEGGQGDRIDRNHIAFSDARAIRVIAGTQAAGAATISHNALGIAPGRASSGSDPEDAGNAGNAVRIESGSGHRILDNDIRFNGSDALVVLGAARQVEIARNRLADNAGLGIDLSPDGVNPVDNDNGASGANDGLNFPVLDVAAGAERHGVVFGLLQSRNGEFRIDLYASDGCDASGHGEAQQLVGSGRATIANAAGANGRASFEIAIEDDAAPLFGRAITAIAVESNGNSSELSACLGYQPGPYVFAHGFEGPG